MWMLLSVLAPLVVGLTGSENITAHRNPRQSIGVFSVVKFPNDACSGNNNLNGTCYTASECTSKGGAAAGSCASSFGVCCTFSLACGASAAENNTYAIISSYSTQSDADPCTYTICKASTDICKLRIDFETMVIASQTAFTTSATAATAQLLAFRAGACESDTLTITNPGGSSPPVICGTNTGQHMYIDASDSCNQIKFDINTGASATRSWQLKVTQYECDSENIPEQDCLQWHTGTSGTFFNFGWDKSITTTTTTSHYHLQNQYYDICFRRERGYCSMCFTPQIFVTSITYTSFGISSAGTGPGTSAIDSLCELTPPAPAVALKPSAQDYIEVLNLQPGTGTTKTLGASRVCGIVFNVSPTAVVHATASPSAASTACTWSTPFKWGVRFNGEEIAAATPVAATAQNTNENYFDATKGGGIGYAGFYMAFFQNEC